MRSSHAVRVPTILAGCVVVVGLLAGGAYRAFTTLDGPGRGQVRQSKFDRVTLGQARGKVVKLLGDPPANQGNVRRPPVAGLACDLYPQYPPAGNLAYVGYTNQFEFCYQNDQLVYKAFFDNDDDCGYGLSTLTPPALPSACLTPTPSQS